MPLKRPFNRNFASKIIFTIYYLLANITFLLYPKSVENEEYVEELLKSLKIERYN